MKEPTLPELPKPYDYGHSQVALNSRPARIGLYSADQMREYARAAVLAERERCAKIAEANKYTGYVPAEDGRARDYYDSAGIDIADAIRGE